MGNKSLIKSSTKINQIHHQQQEVIQQYAPVEVLCRDCGGKSTVWNWNTYGQCEASVEVMSHECFWIKTCGNTGNSHTTHISIHRFYMFLLIVHFFPIIRYTQIYTDILFQPHVNLYIYHHVWHIRWKLRYICKNQVTIEHHIDLCAPRSNHFGSVDPGLISHGHGDWFGVGSHRIGGDRNRNY